MIPLTIVRPGKGVTMVDICVVKAISSKLYSIELVPGVRLTVLENRDRPIMIGVQDTRLSPDLGMAKKMMGG